MRLPFFLHIKKHIVVIVLLAICSFMAIAQPYTTINLSHQKPNKYINSKLQSEKTSPTRIFFLKRFFQNTFTYYNYFFNANIVYQNIIEHAKEAHADDYSKLLSFYNYSYDQTATQKTTLDTLFYKCNAGILLHDLRNDWNASMYFLYGQYYMCKKNFDSAFFVFQYINFTYAPRDGDYEMPIGSSNGDRKAKSSIFTKERTGVFATKYQRNETLLWLVRANLERGKTNRAYSLLAVIRADPMFPKRLTNQLNELVAYCFYKQHEYDSAAVYLEKALVNADNWDEKARWLYLCGQLYQRGAMHSAAVAAYKRAIRFSSNPIMNAYARTNILQLAATAQGFSMSINIATLHKFARRGRYEPYRSIIYYTVALLEVQEGKHDDAIKDFQLSLRYNPVQEQQQKTFLALADLCFSDKKYQKAQENYDSIVMSLISPVDTPRVALRRSAIKQILANNQHVTSEDSLQTIASLPPTNRIHFLKKYIAQQEKIKQKALRARIAASLQDEGGNQALDFTQINNAAMGVFYFSSTVIKTEGYYNFKKRWGNRPNVDNWRRSASIFMSSNVVDSNNIQTDTLVGDTSIQLTVDALLKKLPLTPSALKCSDSIIKTSLFINGSLYQNELRDYQSAISVFEDLLHRYPVNNKNEEQTLFNILYCYKQLLDSANAAKIQATANLLQRKYPNGKYTQLFLTNTYVDLATVNATKKYTAVYNLLRAGLYDQALDAKKAIDTSIGVNTWTPQLLFVEAMYHAKKKEDSVAIKTLEAILANQPSLELSDKAQMMIDLLKHRDTIENYLSNYWRENNTLHKFKEEDTAAINLQTNTTTTTNAKVDSATVRQQQKVAITPVDATSVKDSLYTFVMSDKHFVMIVFTNVTSAYVKEANIAFGKYNEHLFTTLTTTLTNFSESSPIIFIGPFDDAGLAIDYIKSVRGIAPTRIVPWLPTNGYTFSLISYNNKAILERTKDIEGYHEFINATLPTKF